MGRGLYDYVAARMTPKKARRIGQILNNLWLLGVLILSLVFLGVLLTIPVMILFGLLWLAGTVRRSREDQGEELEKRLEAKLRELRQPTAQAYTCPHCKRNDLEYAQNFCNGCGCKLNWGS